MTTAETIHIYALIALRALADYDPYEFRRSTDLSKQELDERIESRLSNIRDTGDERRIADVTEILRDLRSLESAPESPPAMSFLLRSVSNSALERASQLALIHNRTGELRRDETQRPYDMQGSPSRARSVRSEPEFLRLGVMRLLHDLPNYNPNFSYSCRNLAIDCFLEPTLEGQPPVLIEAKSELPSMAAAQAALAQLKRLVAGWGRGVIAAVLTTNISQEAREHWRRAGGKFFVLAFDPETNEFYRADRDALIEAVRSA